MGKKCCFSAVFVVFYVACKYDFVPGADRIGVNVAIRTRDRCFLVSGFLGGRKCEFASGFYRCELEVIHRRLYVKNICQVLQERTPAGGVWGHWLLSTPTSNFFQISNTVIIFTVIISLRFWIIFV